VEDRGVRQRLELALRTALRVRDTIAVSALRSALAAIDNAAAIPVRPAGTAGASSPHFAGSAAGLGAAEAMRRPLREGEAEQIVRAEVAERQAAAGDYERAGHADRADRLRCEARVLTSALETGRASSGEP
jgi:uncharacterized protein YqeY